MAHRPYSTRAQRALALAQSASASMDKEYVGTEHILLGLLEETTGPAAQILNHLGVTSDRVRSLLLEGPPERTEPPDMRRS